MPCDGHILFSIYPISSLSFRGILLPHSFSIWLKESDSISIPSGWTFNPRPLVLLPHPQCFNYENQCIPLFCLDNSSSVSNMFNSILAKTLSAFLNPPSEIFTEFMFFNAFLTAALYTNAMLFYCLLFYRKFSIPTTSFYLFFFLQRFKHFGQSQTIF